MQEARSFSRYLFILTLVGSIIIHLAVACFTRIQPYPTLTSLPLLTVRRLTPTPPTSIKAVALPPEPITRFSKQAKRRQSHAHNSHSITEVSKITTALASVPSSPTLIPNPLNIEHLLAQVQTLSASSTLNTVAKLPQDYTWKRYQADWRLKVERVGNLNYPEESRRSNIYGAVILEVILTAEGSLRSVQIKHSSGWPVLDKAAYSIVRRASPFAPCPPSVVQRFPT